MTADAITRKQALAQIPYETARQIRELLDKARKTYGADDWDSEAWEDAVLALVTDEE